MAELEAAKAAAKNAGRQASNKPPTSDGGTVSTDIDAMVGRRALARPKRVADGSIRAQPVGKSDRRLPRMTLRVSAGQPGQIAALKKSLVHSSSSNSSRHFNALLRAGARHLGHALQAEKPASPTLADTTRNFSKGREKDAQEPAAPPSGGERRDEELTLHADVAWDPLALFTANAAPASAVVPRAAAGLEPVVAQLVRSIAWGGDRRRGTARLELGGRYAGAVVRVHASGDALSIELDAPPGVDGAELGARLGERLAARGLRVDSVVVR
jgi:hypothetical protein